MYKYLLCCCLYPFQLLKGQAFQSALLHDATSGVYWHYDEMHRAYALADAGGRALSTYRYTAPAPFDGNIAVVPLPGKRYELLMLSGKPVPGSESDFYHPGVNGTFCGEKGLVFDKKGRRLRPYGPPGQWFCQTPEDSVGIVGANGQWLKGPWKYSLPRELELADPPKQLQTVFPQTEKGKWGAVDTAGRWVVPCLYDTVLPFRKGYALVGKGGFWGAVDTLGRLCIPAMYTQLGILEDGQAYFDYDGYRSFAAIADCPYLLEHPAEALPILPEEQEYEIIDTAHQAPFIQAPFYEGLAVASDGKGKLGYVDALRQWIIPPQFTTAHRFRGGLAAVSTETGTGILKRDGTLLIPAVYDKVEPASEGPWGYFKVKKGLFYGLIDTNGRVICPADRFTNIFKHTEGTPSLLRVYQGKLFGLLDSTGRLVLPTEYEDVYRDNPPGGILAQKGGFWGMVDFENRVLLPFVYKEVQSAGKGFVKLYAREGGVGLFNQEMQLLIPARFEDIWLRQDAETGWFRAKQYGRWGWIDRTGKVMIPFRYEVVSDFHQGLAYVLLAPADKLHSEPWLSGDYGGVHYFPWPEHIRRINKRGEMVW